MSDNKEKIWTKTFDFDNIELIFTGYIVPTCNHNIKAYIQYTQPGKLEGTLAYAQFPKNMRDDAEYWLKKHTPILK